MKLPSKPLTFLALAMSVAAIAVYGIAQHSNSNSESRIAALKASGNCQSDVVIPFIQSHGLAHVKAETGDTFSAFLAAQVHAGLIADSAAKQVLTSIATTGQGEPVYTHRGWLMPLIAENR